MSQIKLGLLVLAGAALLLLVGCPDRRRFAQQESIAPIADSSRPVPCRICQSDSVTCDKAWSIQFDTQVLATINKTDSNVMKPVELGDGTVICNAGESLVRITSLVHVAEIHNLSSFGVMGRAKAIDNNTQAFFTIGGQTVATMDEKGKLQYLPVKNQLARMDPIELDSKTIALRTDFGWTIIDTDRGVILHEFNSYPLTICKSAAYSRGGIVSVLAARDNSPLANYKTPRIVKYLPSGQIEWETDPNNKYFLEQSVSDGESFVLSDLSKIYMFSNAGVLLWERSMPKAASGKSIISVPLALWQEKVFASNGQDHLLCCASNGTVLWDDDLGTDYLFDCRIWNKKLLLFAGKDQIIVICPECGRVIYKTRVPRIRDLAHSVPSEVVNDGFLTFDEKGILTKWSLSESTMSVK